MEDFDLFYQRINTVTKDGFLAHYSHGYYAMMCPFVDDSLSWQRGPNRAYFDLSFMNIPRSTQREALIRKPFEISVDRDFAQVIEQCGEIDRGGHQSIWLGKPLRNIFNQLHDDGIAHSVEARNQKGDLVGGVFGFQIGKVFFGKSMFNHEPNASKVAFTHLAARLWHGGFGLFDSQTHSAHLAKQFGQERMPRYIFQNVLAQNIQLSASFNDEAMPDEHTMVQNFVDYLKQRRQEEIDMLTRVHNSVKPV